MEPTLVLAIVIYFVAMLGIGYYFLVHRRADNLSEYFLGSRKINPYVAALSAQASDMSGWMLMGLPGAILLGGLGEVWIGIGLAIGSYICWIVVAKRLRKHSVVSGNAITMSEFFSNRFHDKKGYLRIVSTIIILFFFTIYVGSGFKACGAVLGEALGLGVTLAIVIGVIVTVAYTMMGGYTAVCWADFAQALLMVICVVVVPIVAIISLGGWSNVVTGWEQVDTAEFTNLFWDYGKPITVVAVVSMLAWGLGYFGMPHIVVRYMSIRHPNDIKVARRVSLIWVVIALSAVTIMALVGRVYLGNPDVMGYKDDHVFLLLAKDLFWPFICGIIYAAILAAIMSTANSQLLVATSSVTNDILKRSEKYKNVSEKRISWISRIVVVIISIVAMVIAISDIDNIMGLVSYAWSGFGSAFGPLMLLSLFWKRMNFQGALAAMIVGFATVLLWETFMGFTGMYSLLPGFVFSLIAGIVVAMLTPPPSKEIEDEFDLAQVYEEPEEDVVVNEPMPDLP